jgi:elongation factor P hydroxylase
MTFCTILSGRPQRLADVFYVTDGEGRKVEDQAQLEQIRMGVREAIDWFLGAKAG